MIINLTKYDRDNCSRRTKIFHKKRPVIEGAEWVGGVGVEGEVTKGDRVNVGVRLRWKLVYIQVI